MKFGFYSPYLDTFGGGERYMLTLASHFSKQYEVDIFWDDYKIKAPLSKFLKINLKNTNFSQNIFKKSLLSKHNLTKKYDVIFVLSDGSIPATFAKKNILHFQVPFTVSANNLGNRIKLAKYKWIIVNSHFTKKFIDKSYNIDSKVIYPPVDIKNYFSGKKEKIILSVGRFSDTQLHNKRQEVLIEVFKELYKKESHWKLILVGQSKKQDYKFVKKLKAMSKGLAIKIHENLDINKLRKIYSQSTIYWHATGFGEDEQKNPQKMEHFGISTVEASASGCIPIVINKGGQKEIVKSGKNGIVWETKTQLLESTLEIINNKEKLKKLANAAVVNSKKFSVARFIKNYEEIIFQ